MNKLLTLVLAFLLGGTLFVHAGCGGPYVVFVRGTHYLGNLSGTTYIGPHFIYAASDTISANIAPTDTIVLGLSLDHSCSEELDSVQWFKDGILVNADYNSGFDFTDTATGPGVYTCKFLWGWGSAAQHITYTFYSSYVTGIANIAPESPDIKVYPNPSNGIFTVDAIGDFNSYNVTIFDVSGRIVQQLKGNDKSFTVDLSGSAPGFYSLLYVSDDGKQRMKKLIYN